MHSTTGRQTRLLAVAGVLALTGVLAACDEFLKAENPGALAADQLDDPKYIPLMVNGVVGEYQGMLDYFIYYTGLFSDELRNTHVFFEERDYDKRLVTIQNGTHSFVYYVPLHRARFMADTMAGRLKKLLGDSASRDLRLARVRNYGGMTYLHLAENLCESPINGSRAYTPDELFAMAVSRFQEAVEIAKAAKAVAGAPAATIASADSLTAWARVGLARAHLGLDEKADALAQADSFLTAVTDTNWKFRALYSENSAGENSLLENRLSAGPSAISGTVNSTPFETMRDRRVPRPAAVERVMNGLNVYVPNASKAHSAYDGTVTGANFTKAGWIRIASWFEARYIKAEAEGNTPANLAFLNAQKKLGEDTITVVPATDSAYLALLRDQRSRELYLDGHRLGDLRRYKAYHGVDLFQRGPYPGTTTGETYDEAECLPLTLAEVSSNPNLNP